MKLIKIPISSDTTSPAVIANLSALIPEPDQNSAEFALLYSQLISCIEDFAQKAQQVGRAGTTIHIQKEFRFPEARVLVVLEYPQKISLLQKLTRFLKIASSK